MRWLVIVVLLMSCGHTFDPLEARDIRASAVAIGAPAPDAQVTLPSGTKVALGGLLRPRTVLVFYRGFY